MLKIAVVEDEVSSQKKLYQFIKHYLDEKEMEFEIAFFDDGSKILKNYVPDYDIIFMDIEMHSVNGMEAATFIRKKDENVEIVFVTNIAQYAVNGYAVGARDYFVKPLKYDVFQYRMERILKKIRAKSRHAIILRSVEEVHKVYIDEIRYVEVLGHNLIYHTDGKDIRVRSSMKKAESELSGYGFYQCNSCYLINLRYVTAVRDDMVCLKDEKLQISRARKKKFIEQVTAYMGSH